ncbi:hypothetical protein niasHT_003875 [Heterodera trifolii]|uniref:GDP-fucose protein O-fucosyltransferase 1 n=1 Tax=Heterodera trifolii TaxID=157864 RepID=A0ABD2LV16_9BILA
MRLFCHLFALSLFSLPFPSSDAFVLFCPCMGRFGNQMEQFLGAFAFAKSLNRTLVLPPIINYPPGAEEAGMIEFDQFFLVPPLAQFHRIVLLRDFSHGIAPKIWPMEKRRVFCWSPRPGLANASLLGCHATEGNPFGPFWRYAGTHFVGEEYFGVKTGGFDTQRETIREKWATE